MLVVYKEVDIEDEDQYCDSNGDDDEREVEIAHCDSEPLSIRIGDDSNRFWERLGPFFVFWLEF